MTTTQQTASAQSPTPVTVDMGRPGIPMTRLIRVELRKLVDTRSGFWLTCAIGIVSAVVMALMLAFADTEALTFGGLFGMMNIPVAIILPVLAILLVTSERGQRTGLVTYTLEPHRARVVFAKLATSLIATVGAVLVALAFGALGNLLAIVFRDAPGNWDMTWVGLGNSALIQLIGLLMGFGFAMLIMNSAAAIVLYFALPQVWAIVTQIVPWLREHIQPWADLGSAQIPLQSGEAITATEWAHLGSAAGIWVVLPLVLGVWRLLRSEVK